MSDTGTLREEPGLPIVGEFFRAAMGFAEPTTAERPEDKLITRMQRWRTILGMAAAVWLVVAYPLSEGGQEFILGKLAELGISCGILVAGSILGITAFLIAGTPDRRRTFARRLLGPIGSIFALALGPALMWLSFTTLKGELIEGGDLKGFFSAITGAGIISSVLAFLVLVIGWLLAIVVLIASVPYTIAIAYACVFSCFRTADVHQLLPALLSPLLVWSLFAFQLFNGPDVAAPPEVLYTFMLGGPLSVTGLSVWEVRRLRTHHGITLRTALGR
ncbi:hypothetical protein AB0F18_08095 [Streptomyces sp. NPDC029216]|uniref:hypothetical protein n=1 Tax=Streptomyces sp. NPDC029216 TaxID=3154701 RepID=UPI0033D53B29